MRIDIRSLGTFNRLVQAGAKHAARSLSQMTGIRTRVEVANVALMDGADIEDAFRGQSFVGVQLGFDGELSGDTVLAFDDESARAIMNVLTSADADDRLAKSGVMEVGNIVMSGFIDGWSDYLGTPIDLAPPSYVEQVGVDVLPDEVRAGRREVFVFKCQMVAADGAVDVFIHLIPEFDAIARLLAARSHDDGLPLEKLVAFKQMTREGASSAGDHITSMTGIDTDVEINQLTFVPIENVPGQVGDEQRVGIVFELDANPSGYLALLFDESSARSLVDALVPGGSDDGFGDMGESAIKEVGNIMTSGFIDGWANVLTTTVAHSPPKFVHDRGSAIVSPIAERLAKRQEHAFVIDSVVKTTDDEITCDIYLLPDEQELAAALEALSLDGSQVGRDADA